MAKSNKKLVRIVVETLAFLILIGATYYLTSYFTERTYQRKIGVLQRETDRLKDEMKAVTTTDEDIRKLKEDYNELKIAYSKKKKELSMAKDSYKKSADELALTKKDLKDLQAPFSKLKDIYAKKKGELASLKENHKKLADELALLKEDLERLKEAYNKLQADYESKINELTTLKRRDMIERNGAPDTSISFGIGIGGRITKQVRSAQKMKRVNTVSQSLDYSCGPAAVATLLSYHYGDVVTEREVIKYLLENGDLEKIKANKGFSLLDLKHFAQSKGYEVVGYRMNIEYLVKLQRPALVPISVRGYDHFVIFRGVKDDRVFLADPAFGNMTMRVSYFSNVWKGGVGLVIMKEEEKGAFPSLLEISEEDTVFTDFKSVQRMLESGLLHTVIIREEF